jgi:hypothetical protein
MKRDRLAEMQLPEGFCLLISRLQRGVMIFRSLYLVFAGCAGAAFFAGCFYHAWIPWAVVAFIMGLACRLAVLLHVAPRYRSARKIVENPQIVYWGHSIDGRGQFTDTTVIESNKIKLHLKDGGQLAVEAVRGTGTSQKQLREVISWLHQRNPSMRWGNYDHPVPNN